MGPYHPECPDRLHAIGDRLIAAGLDAGGGLYPTLGISIPQGLTALSKSQDSRFLFSE